jgi:hypothetical protein
MYSFRNIPGRQGPPINPSSKNGAEGYDDEVIAGTRYVSMMIRLRPGDDRAEPTCFQRRNFITSAPCFKVPAPQ